MFSLLVTPNSLGAATDAGSGDFHCHEREAYKLLPLSPNPLHQIVLLPLNLQPLPNPSHDVVLDPAEPGVNSAASIQGRGDLHKRRSGMTASLRVKCNVSIYG